MGSVDEEKRLEYGIDAEVEVVEPRSLIFASVLLVSLRHTHLVLNDLVPG